MCVDDRFRLLSVAFLVFSSCAARASDVEQLAQKLIHDAGVGGGIVVHLDCGDGKLTTALHLNDSYLIQGLDANVERVMDARRYVRSQGLYGKVSIDQLRGDRLPFVDNFVNLVVTRSGDDRSLAEINRVLTPGGVAMLETDNGWIRHTKPRSNKLDDWTHSLHSGANNPVADDTVVGPPRQLQWICGPAWSKHHEKYPPTIPVMVSSGGRVFYFEDETPTCVFNLQTRWSLVARDAFNGTLLWRKPMRNWEPAVWPGDLGGGLSGGPIDYRRRLVAVGDRVYVTQGYSGPVVALDAVTGRKLQTYGRPGSHSTEIVHYNDSLVVSQRMDSRGEFLITCFDAQSAARRWEAPGGYGMAVDAGRVLFIQRDQIGAIDAESGESIWRTSPLAGMDKGSEQGKGGRRSRPRLQGPLRTGEGIVLACPGARGAVVALSVDNGEVLWTFQNQGFRPFFRPVTAWIIDGLVWVTSEGQVDGEVPDDYFVYGLDPQTGAVLKKVPCGAVWNCGHHQRCYPSKATSRFLIFSRRGAEFLELATAQVNLNNWTRGACGYGVMPANGLMYAPPHSCRCYSEAALRGLHVLAPAQRGPMLDGPEPEAARHQRGPAFGQTVSWTTRADGWLTYRHDAQRSGSATTSVKTDLQPSWRVELPGRSTQPVICGSRLLVSVVDSHTIHALDVASGKELWTYTTGGRLDTPPTIHEGLALAGCTDGWVYCLRVDNGQLVWRFRASPHDIRMGSKGQIESVWPVHGAVLVQDGVAYFAAGRGSFVDGGIWVYGVDAATGKKRFEHQYAGPYTGAGFTRDNPGRGFVMPGALPDVLVTDGQRIYMRHLAFDLQLKEVTDMEPNFYNAPVRAGEEFGGDHKYWCDLLEVGPRAFVGKPEWNFRSYFNNFPGQRLYSTTGLLDDSWHIRSYWSYGQIVGQSLVFDGERGYAVQAYPNAARWATYEAGDGYVLYAGRTRTPEPDERLYALKAPDRDWETRLPLRPTAMLLADDVLFVAGPPDDADPAEAMPALEGQSGALLQAIATTDGALLREIKLAALPVFDGMAAANNRLYISTQDGALVCYE